MEEIMDRDVPRLIHYLRKKRDHARTNGGAVLESLDLWELEEIVAALEHKYPRGETVKDESNV